MVSQNYKRIECEGEIGVRRSSILTRNSFSQTQAADSEPAMEIVWRNVFLFSYLHLAAFFGLYFLFTGQVMLKTFLWGIMWHVGGSFGVTAGAHRLWSHKCYKANLPLRIILIFLHTVAGQNSAFDWCRDHRLHHKFSETNADPHNANRGFFFSHIGWLLCRKHPAIKEKGKVIDMSDLLSDPVIMFQHKYYAPMVILISFVIPTVVPWYLWEENFIVSFFYVAQFRYCFSLHCTWLVNSAAHLWGGHPYDNSINPGENQMVSILAIGEGFHNYHHTFPWDYKAAELGNYKYNFTTAMLDMFAYIGWATDLKTAQPEVVLNRLRRQGDGSHRLSVAPSSESPAQELLN